MWKFVYRLIETSRIYLWCQTWVLLLKKCLDSFSYADISVIKLYMGHLKVAIIYNRFAPVTLLGNVYHDSTFIIVWVTTFIIVYKINYYKFVYLKVIIAEIIKIV